MDRLEALADRIAGAGGEAAYARTDVKRREDLSDLVKLACERYGKLDVLVNNAGVMPISPLDDLRVEDWEEMIDVNIKGVLYGIAAALPVFASRVSGISSTSLLQQHISIVPNMSVYSGTKFAVRAISEGLRQEAGDKLRVTIISPGFARTNFDLNRVTNPEAEMPSSEPRPETSIAMAPDAIARAIAVPAIEGSAIGSRPESVL